MKDLRNRIVVITGASSGFGRGVAEKFARSGAHVVLAARRGTLLEKIARDCSKRGVRALAVETDVSDRSEVEALAQRVLNEFGRFDVWVNNAGVATYGRLNDCPIDEHEQVIRTNLLGVIYGSRAALQQFRQQGHGVLINVGSFAGIASFPYGSSYTASKHGVRGFGTALRQELQVNGDENIHVCTVMPTSMDTPFFEHAANHTGHPVVPIPPVYDPQLVVDAIFEVATSPKDEVVVGGRGKAGKLLSRIAPGLMETQMAKKAHQSMMEQQETEPPSSGNLFAPLEHGSDVRGGWKRASLGTRLLKTAISAGIPAFLGYAIWSRTQQQNQARQPQAA